MANQQELTKIKSYARKLSLMAFAQNIRPYIGYSLLGFAVVYSVLISIARGDGILLLSLLLPVFLIFLMAVIFCATSVALYRKILKFSDPEKVDIQINKVSLGEHAASRLEAELLKYLSIKLETNNQISWFVYTKPKLGDSGTLFVIHVINDGPLGLLFSPIFPALLYNREQDALKARHFLELLKSS